jgi:acyl-CoA reductase-like NAD-dependent aldehyde dehydrogenase
MTPSVFHPMGTIRLVTPAEEATTRATPFNDTEATMANFGLHTAYPLPEHVAEARRAAADRVARRSAARRRAMLRRLRDLGRALQANVSWAATFGVTPGPGVFVRPPVAR